MFGLTGSGLALQHDSVLSLSRNRRRQSSRHGRLPAAALGDAASRAGGNGGLPLAVVIDRRLVEVLVLGRQVVGGQRHAPLLLFPLDVCGGLAQVGGELFDGAAGRPLAAHLVVLRADMTPGGVKAEGTEGQDQVSPSAINR